MVSTPVLQVADLRSESRWQQTFTSYFGSLVCGDAVRLAGELQVCAESQQEAGSEASSRR